MGAGFVNMDAGFLSMDAGFVKTRGLTVAGFVKTRRRFLYGNKKSKEKGNACCEGKADKMGSCLGCVKEIRLGKESASIKNDPLQKKLAKNKVTY